MPPLNDRALDAQTHSQRTAFEPSPRPKRPHCDEASCATPSHDQTADVEFGPTRLHLQRAPTDAPCDLTPPLLQRARGFGAAPRPGPSLAQRRPASGCATPAGAGRTVNHAAALVAAAVLFGACQKPTAASAARAAAPAAVALPVLTAARATEAMVLDGELGDEVWKRAESSPTFLDAHRARPVVPHTEARAAFTDQALWVGLYSADEDLTSADAVGFTAFAGTPRQTRFSLDPAGALTCDGALCALDGGRAAVRGKVDADGTLDQPTDEDEEWAAEFELPWSVLGLEPGSPVPVSFFRRDRLKDGTALELVWPRGSAALVKTR